MTLLSLQPNRRCCRLACESSGHQPLSSRQQCQMKPQLRCFLPDSARRLRSPPAPSGSHRSQRSQSRLHRDILISHTRGFLCKSDALIHGNLPHQWRVLIMHVLLHLFYLHYLFAPHHQGTCMQKQTAQPTLTYQTTEYHRSRIKAIFNTVHNKMTCSSKIFFCLRELHSNSRKLAYIRTCRDDLH